MEQQAVRVSRTTPKDFFLWAGAMIALYWSVVSFIFLIFNYINYALPNALSYSPNPYDGGMPYEMASILVLIPVYIILALLIRRDIARDASKQDIWVRRWAIILTLFVAGVTVAVDIITLLTTFFRGEELTTAFLLKVFVVVLVAAIGFGYFLLDLRGYWDMHRAKERLACIVLALVMLVSIVAGFFIVGTPAQARLMRLDTERVAALQDIQWRIVNYWQNKEVLPSSLTALEDSISGYQVPVDPVRGTSYEYHANKGLSFQLCATFDRAADQSARNYYYPEAPMTKNGAGDSWAHASGHVCFDRTIDPTLYPPTTKGNR